MTKSAYDDLFGNHRPRGTRLLIIRHGETAWNREGRVQGHLCRGIDEVGRLQAARLARRLVGETIDVAYSSDLPRAAETARIALEGRDVPLTLLADLRESSLGEWEGQLASELVARYPEIIAARKADPANVPVPGGETLLAVQERAWRAIEAIVARHPGQNVLVTTHGGPVRLIALKVLGQEIHHYWDLRAGNCGLTIVEHDGQEYHLVLMDDCGHLDNGLE